MYLDLNHLCDTAIYACIIVTFYSISRLGEFTVPSLLKFNNAPAPYIKCLHFTVKADTKGLPILSFHIPFMKCCPEGEDMHCAPLDHLTDPAIWLNNHLHINYPAQEDHLFTWRHPKGLCPLTKTEVTKCLNELVTQYNLPNIKGHGFCIKGTLHYLLLGTPFDISQNDGEMVW
ncbi:hypothetical protein ID866_11664 [Astraeus odoratus]|nr:hypothetical protein ID866_11664 [Astraeus odoratus]